MNKIDGQRGESRILLDNSTYFSFKRLIEARKLDADTLYNASNFLECLLVADNITLSPTVAWMPDDSDTLFGIGLCRQLDTTRLDDAALSRVFQKAIRASRADLARPETARLLGIEAATAARADALMKSWEMQLADSPRAFLRVYSGTVFLTDAASSDIVSEIPTIVSRSDALYRHIAHFLLRTNAALEFSHTLATLPAAYHPHSYRASYVTHRLRRLAEASEALASTLLRETEVRVAEQITALRTSTWLRLWGGFSNLGDDAPLVLAVALSASATPDQLITRVLELRETREARRFRRWTTALVTATSTGDIGKQLEAERELQAAREVLGQELRRLYGAAASGTLAGATSTVVSALDLEDVADLNIRKLGLSAFQEAISGAPKIRAALERMKIKHKIAFLVRLAKNRKGEVELAGLVERVFGQKLAKSDLERLAHLRRLQATTVERLRSGGS